jgi:hypothetical protein
VLSLIVDRRTPVDAFEELVSDIFWNEGFWVRTGFKVELMREEKIRIGRHSSPRWEIDLVAYSATSNQVLALECKSYLDSGGVHAAHFAEGSRYAARYKLFHDATLRETVLERLRLQMTQCGLCPSDASIRLGLVHAHATSRNAALLREIFDANDWLLFGPDWIRERLGRMSRGSYENNTAALVAKLLLRGAA